MQPFIDIHTHILRKSSDVVAVYNLKPDESILDSTFSCGVHPWHINPMNYYSQVRNVENILIDKNAIFIGECGLDKIKPADFKLQQTVFQLHINLAMKHQKPMILHCVKAYDEILSMVKNKVSPDKVIFHGFGKSPELATDLTSKGYFISLGKSVFAHSEKMKGILEGVNPEKIFFETDESGYSIEEIYQKAAEISGKSLEFWKSQLNQNFERVKQNGMKVH